MEYDKYCEYIVVGIGGIGSGALYWLAKRAGKGTRVDQEHVGPTNINDKQEKHHKKHRNFLKRANVQC